MLGFDALDEEDDDNLTYREDQLKQKIAGIRGLILPLDLGCLDQAHWIYLLECQEFIFTQGCDMSP